MNGVQEDPDFFFSKDSNLIFCLVFYYRVEFNILSIIISSQCSLPVFFNWFKNYAFFRQFI